MGNIQTKNFKGLSLHPHDVFKNVGVFIEAAGLLTAVTDEEYQEVSDILLEFARKYVDTARETELRKLQ